MDSDDLNEDDDVDDDGGNGGVQNVFFVTETSAPSRFKSPTKTVFLQ
jgi:hypothetical protein